jgi:hypothetical protein
MLRLIIEGDESFNEEEGTFETFNEVVVNLEHSLISLSKWESEYQKPFLSSETKTSEEIFGYLKVMIMTPDVDPEVLYRASQENITKIQEYIDSTQSATTFGMMPERRGPGEVITSELIYYWMVAFNIPFECEHWHLNRLFSLIRICNIKNSNSNQRKMSRSELARRNQELNARRRAELNTTG